MKKYFQYYKAFFKIGLFTIGGGYAMLPSIEKEIIEGKKWATEEDVMNSYALAQSIPGIIAVNTAVLLGYKIDGYKAAIAFCLGVISPSVIIILLIANIYDKISDNVYVANAFKGIRIAVVALLLSTLVRLFKKSIKDIFGILFAVVAFITIVIFDISPLYVIIIGAVISVLVYYRRSDENDNSTS